MNNWLQEFPYQVEIEPWIFIVTGFGFVFLAMITTLSQGLRSALSNPVDFLRDE